MQDKTLAKIEIRPLNKLEFDRLLEEAPEEETRNLKRITGELKVDPYIFFLWNACEGEGLVVDGRPCYMAYLVPRNGTYYVWTVVNRNVRHQFTLFKGAKRILYQWLDKYRVIRATMEKVNPKNTKWTKRLGFKVINDNGKLITFELRGG